MRAGLNRKWRAVVGGALAVGTLAVVATGATLMIRAEREPEVAAAAAAAAAPPAAVSPARTAESSQAAAAVPASTPLQTAAAQPVSDGMTIRRVLDIDGPFTHGRWVWDEAGAPANGPLVVTIDLDAQVLSVFRDGYEIGAAVILYGADWKPTPLGIYPITQKDADHVSNLYGAPMPYMLRLTNDGISIHGSDVEEGAATHGCIGVPTAFAKKLFAVAKLGDKVIVTNGERLQLGGAITAI